MSDEKRSRKRSAVQAEQKKETEEMRDSEPKKKKSEFKIMYELIQENKDKNPTPEWRERIIKRSGRCRPGRSRPFILNFIPAMIAEIPPYKQEGPGPYRNPLRSILTEAPQHLERRRKIDQLQLRPETFVCYDLADLSQDSNYEQPLENDQEDELVAMFAKLRIDDNNDTKVSVDAITDELSSIKIAQMPEEKAKNE